MRYFHIAAGTIAYRSKEPNGHAVQASVASWEYKMTEKPVIYAAADRNIFSEANDPYYIFELPARCLPYRWFIVACGLVALVDTE